MQEFIGRPFFQFVFFILLSMVIVPVAKPKNAESVYTIAGVIYVVYIVVNSVLIWLAPKVWTYFFYSMIFSVVYLLVAGALAATYIQITKTDGSREGAMIFLVALYHPFASLLVIFLQWAVRLIRAQ